MSKLRIVICLSAFLISLTSTTAFADDQPSVAAQPADVMQTAALSDISTDMEQLSTMNKEDGEYLPKKFFNAGYLLKAKMIKPDHVQEKLGNGEVG